MVWGLLSDHTASPWSNAHNAHLNLDALSLTIAAFGATTEPTEAADFRWNSDKDICHVVKTLKRERMDANLLWARILQGNMNRSMYSMPGFRTLHEQFNEGEIEARKLRKRG